MPDLLVGRTVAYQTTGLHAAKACRMIALSKTMDPQDFSQLVEERNTVVLHGGDDLAQQHEARVWEYSLALRAFRQWQLTQPPLRIWSTLDVGGAGSPLAQLLRGGAGLVTATVCDPHTNGTVEELARVSDRTYDAIFSISTIEHVPEEGPFLAALVQLLAPGGLLFLTTDYWDGEGADTAHFHWDRQRIYNGESWQRVRADLRTLGMQTFGGTDACYHGHQLYGSYTFVSLCMIKESR